MPRLFFALWPDAAAREALADRARQVAERCGGRAVPAGNLHLTLVFLGDVDEGRVKDLVRAAEGVRGNSFNLDLDRIGGFRRSGVAWAGCRQAPAELIALQACLERRIGEAGFRPEERAYAPHLTLARRVRAAPEGADAEAVTWRVGAFALVESVRGAGTYRTVAEWPLEAEKT